MRIGSRLFYAMALARRVGAAGKYLEGTGRQKAPALSPAVITEGGRTVWLAGQSTWWTPTAAVWPAIFGRQAREIFA
jgi:hypothetical protein